MPDSLFVKIDVEGYEDEVFLGLVPILKEIPQWRVMCELNKKCVEDAGKDFNQWSETIFKTLDCRTIHVFGNSDIIIGN